MQRLDCGCTALEKHGDKCSRAALYVPLSAPTSGLHICLVDTGGVMGSAGERETWLLRPYTDTHLAEREREREEGRGSTKDHDINKTHGIYMLHVYFLI